MAVKPSIKSDQSAASAPITGDQLFGMGHSGRAELVKGELVMMSPTGHRHGYIEGKVYRALDTFVSENNLGHVLVGEVGIYTGRNPDTVRGADVIYISHQRLEQVMSESFLDVAPELVVEIMSPNDTWREITDKLEEYFNIGVVAVWVVDPQKQQIYVYHSVTEIERFTGGDTLSAGPELPEFSVPVASLFETG